MILIIDDDVSVLRQTSEQAKKLGAQHLAIYFDGNNHREIQNVFAENASTIDTVLCDGLHRNWSHFLNFVRSFSPETRFILVTATPPFANYGIEVWDKSNRDDTTDLIHNLFREYGQREVKVEVESDLPVE